MADIRIKDLATTATTTASDDFMAVDGVTNGTRKLSAATPAFLTSVTTPSLTAPASTDLTLAGGSSGANLVLGQGATAANVTLNATTSGFLSFTKSEDSSAPSLARLLNAGATTAGRYHEVIFGKSLVNGGAGTLGYKSDTATPANSRLFLVHYGNNQDTGGINLTNTGNLLIGTSTSPASYGKLVVSGGMTTSDDANSKLVVGRYSAGTPNSYIKLGALSTSLRITNAADSADLVTILNAGEVSIASTTASSSAITGALQVAGGIGVAGASYFGGKITSGVSTATGYNQLYDTTGLTTGRGAFAITSTGAGLAFGVESSVGGTSFTGSTAYASYFGTTTATPIHFVTNSVIRQTIDSTGAATFAGAVSLAGSALTITGTGSQYIYFPSPAWSGGAQAYSGVNFNAATSSTGDYWGFNIPTGKGYSFAINASSVFSIVSGAATFAGAVSVSGTAATWTSGTGSPESVKTAPVGSLYTRTDGGASTTLYVKESGAGNTGWIAK